MPKVEYYYDISEEVRNYYENLWLDLKLYQIKKTETDFKRQSPFFIYTKIKIVDTQILLYYNQNDMQEVGFTLCVIIFDKHTYSI